MTTTPDVPEASGNETLGDDDAMFDDLARRAGAALRRPAPDDGAQLVARRGRRRQILKATTTGAVVVASLLAVVVVLATREESSPTPVTPVPTTVTEATSAGGRSFADAIAASGLLTGPSAAEIAQATQDVYAGAPVDVSESGNQVSLWTCRFELSATCGNRVVYLTRTAGDTEVHRGVLGDANPVYLLLRALDDRYFVAWESAPDARAPSQAWLIDAATGSAGVLSWRDEPTTIDGREKMVLLDGGPTASDLPKVVDARDGTIRPLAMPADIVAADAIVHGDLDRIWVGTYTDGDGSGLASTDDGGATWDEVALPASLRSRSEDVKVAAEGDRVAVTASGLTSGDAVYVSEDAGRSWTTATIPTLEEGNNLRMDVLADGRLALMWGLDAHPKQLLVSTGSDWADLELVDSVKIDGETLTVSTLWERYP